MKDDIQTQIESTIANLKLSEVPSRFELVQSAAALRAAGLIGSHTAFKDTAKEALIFWKACGDAIAEWIDGEGTTLKQRRSRLEFLNRLPKPRGRFPISLGVALRSILGRRSEAECLPLFRRYLADNGVPSRDISAHIADYKRRPIEQIEYLSLAEAIWNWLPGDRSRRASKAARAKNRSV